MQDVFKLTARRTGRVIQPGSDTNKCWRWRIVAEVFVVGAGLLVFALMYIMRMSRQPLTKNRIGEVSYKARTILALASWILLQSNILARHMMENRQLPAIMTPTQSPNAPAPSTEPLVFKHYWYAAPEVIAAVEGH